MYSMKILLILWLLLFFFLKIDYPRLTSQTLPVTKDDLELLLPLSLEFWDDRHVLLCLVYVGLEMEPRASWILGNHATH